MDVNKNNLWLALCELGDHFSRLGGSARYQNMSESEIPLYIVCRLFEKYSPNFNQKDILDSRFLEMAQPALKQANKYIDSVNSTDENLCKIIIDFVQYADSRLKDDKTTRWLKFVEFINQQTKGI